MSHAELDALAALYEDASPGPWEISHIHRGIYNPVWMVLFPDRKVEPPDAKLIVAMHAALPKLVSALRESQSACEAAFARGVAAMRQAAADEVDCNDPECGCRGDLHAERIRALPTPEYKP